VPCRCNVKFICFLQYCYVTLYAMGRNASTVVPLIIKYLKPCFHCRGIAFFYIFQYHGMLKEIFAVLAGADLGIAMGGIGSDAAIEAADVVLMDDDIGKLAAGICIARNTQKIVRQNITFALGAKILVLALSVPGIATMWMAVFADVGVAVLAILNAMRKKD